MIDAKGISTPMNTATSLTLFDGTAVAPATQYRQTTGSLQNLSLTIPTIAFAVNKLSQFMHRPTIVHWQIVKHLLRYLKGTASLGLFLQRQSPISVHAFSDSDQAGTKDDSTFTIAYVVFLGSNPVSLSSKKQKSVFGSSTEAEYRSVAHTTFELWWIQSLFKELQVASVTTPIIYCDNISTTYVYYNPKVH